MFLVKREDYIKTFERHEVLVFVAAVELQIYKNLVKSVAMETKQRHLFGDHLPLTTFRLLSTCPLKIPKTWGLRISKYILIFSGGNSSMFLNTKKNIKLTCWIHFFMANSHKNLTVCVFSTADFSLRSPPQRCSCTGSEWPWKNRHLRPNLNKIVVRILN